MEARHVTRASVLHLSPAPQSCTSVVYLCCVPQNTKDSLYIDVMHVNDIMFLVSVSKHIGLVQCICIRKKDREKFLHAILLMICVYCARGIFEVVSIGTDKAFDAVESEIKDKPYNVTLTTCDADRHGEFVERMI